MRLLVQTSVSAKRKKKIPRKASIFVNQMLYFEIACDSEKGNDYVFVTNVPIITNGFLEDYRDHKSSPILPSVVEM
jgi:hypothetical protein